VTDSATPGSGVHDADPYLTSGAIRYGGGDWVVPSDTVAFADHEELSNTPLNAFDESHSGSSLDVEIDTGELFVEGSWAARDATTTVTLVTQTDNQIVYVGWEKGTSNAVVVGLDAAFDPAWPRIGIHEFDTDGSGVTAARDRRPLGEQIDVRNEGSVANADQAANADNLDGKDSAQFMRSDVEDAHEEPIEFGARASLSGALGSGAGELFRAGGGASDTLLQTQSGFGRVAWSWNARYDSANNEWRYIVGSEPAMVVLLDGGQVQFLTAAAGTADDPITFDKATVENGSIDDADHADDATHADVADDLTDVSAEKLKGLGSLTSIGANSTGERSSLHAENNIDILDFMPPDGREMEVKHGGQKIISGSDPQHGSFSNPLYSGGSGYYILDSGYTDNEGSIRYTVY